MTDTSQGNHRAGGHFQIFNLGVFFCSTTWTCSLSQLSRPMPCRHYIPWKHRLWRASRDYGVHFALSRCSGGGRGASNPGRAGSSWHLGRGLAATAAKMPPQRREGAGRRRARGATHTVIWRTGGQKVMENVTYFEHIENERFLVPNRGAPDVTHTDTF